MENETVIGRIPTADQMTVDQRTAGEIATITTQATGIHIRNAQDYTEAAELAKAIKQKAKSVKDFYAPVKDAAHAAHKIACAQEKKLLDPLNAAEKAIKNEMGRYTMEQERARRAAEEAARNAREEITNHLIAHAIAMDEAGDTAAAQTALDEAQIMSETPAVIGKPVEAVKGIIQKNDYEVIVTDETAVPVSVMGVIIRSIDFTAIKKLARATSGQIHIPGIAIRETISTTIRAN